MVKSIVKRFAQTVGDLNERWTPIGSIFIIFIFILSIVANGAQLLSSFPVRTTVSLPLPLILFILIAGVAAFISIAIQLSTDANEVMKRSGVTPLTNIFIHRRTGILHFGEIRNVLIRVDTIREVFTSVSELSPDEEKTQKTLYDIGVDVGKDFADMLYDASTDARKSNMLSNMIDLWCEYDVEAGWGKFGYEPGASVHSGVITVRNNFLLAPPGNVHENLLVSDRLNPTCSFMRGYISGVLLVFMRILEPTSKWGTEVIEANCGVSQQNHSCRFEFMLYEQTEDG